jgi:hypothetical protein
MNLDVSTLLGVAGVVLTVLFFVVGYRQTIGARKERARAANKAAVDTIFRRLTLEDKFDINQFAINRLLSGWALESRVRLGDMLSIDQIYSLLLCRSVESDYLSAEQRIAVLGRLDEFFKETQEKSIAIISSRKESWDETGWLAIASASAAMITSSVAALALFNESKALEHVINGTDKNLLIMFVAIASGVVLTAFVLATFTRLRESTRSTNETAQSGGFEHAFIEKARQINPNVKAHLRWPDLSFEDDVGKVAVELKGALEPMSMSQLRILISDVERCAEIDGYTCVLIVSAVRQNTHAKECETDRIKIVRPTEALQRIRAARHKDKAAT